MLKHTLTAAALAAMVAGCTVKPQPAFRAVDAMVSDRTGHHLRWDQGAPEDAQAQAGLHELLTRDLTADSAVPIALLNNHDLQATLERIGIGQADLVQAGLLRNPEFAASWRLPDRAPRQTDAEYSISENFLELLMLPLRKKVAAAELQRTEFAVADAVVHLTTEVKIAVYTLQAQSQLVDGLNQAVGLAQAAAELAGRQHAAGNITDLDLADHQTLLSQSRVDVAQAALTLVLDRENLNRLLGLQDDNPEWHLAKLPAAIPADEPPLEELESRALRQRLDLAAARQTVEAQALALGITENFRYLAAIQIGADTEHNPGGPNVTGPTLHLELPLFDQGQARVAASQSQYRRARQEFLQLTIEVRSQVRGARQRLIARRDLALAYSQELVPQRARIVKLTQLEYNAMLKGTYELVQSRQGQIAAEQASIAARRDYWIARAQLEQALGGKFTADNPTTAPASQPAKKTRQRADNQ